MLRFLQFAVVPNILTGATAGIVGFLIVCGGTGCTSIPSTDDIPTERRDALVKMASDWGFDVSKLEYPE